MGKTGAPVLTHKGPIVGEQIAYEPNFNVDYGCQVKLTLITGIHVSEHLPENGWKG